MPPTLSAEARIPAQLWLAVRIDNLSLLVVEPAARRLPLVVIDGSGARQQVVACNEFALRQGIRPGHDLNAAHALALDLCVRVAEPQREAGLLTRLARWATQYTPLVSLEPPATLLLEVRGSLRLFGGAPALWQRLQAGLEQQGCRATLACAPTPLAALWLTQAGQSLSVESVAQLAGSLASLPLSCLAWPEATVAALWQLGARTLADIVRLPREGLARRYGIAVLQQLDQAFGRAPTPRRRYLAPERYGGRYELEAETTSLAVMDPVIEQLLRDLEQFLRTRAAVVTACTLTFEHRQAACTRVTLGLLQPGSTAARFRLLLDARLARLELPAPVLAVRLRSAAAIPETVVPASLGLQAGAAPAAPEALLERLRARLGETAVAGVCLVPEHRPEAAWRRIAAAAGRPRSRRAAGLPQARSAPRPLWLLTLPQPLASVNGQPCHEGPLTIASDAERIESGWWDGADVARDYYIAVRGDAVRLWIYRERSATQQWWLHGIFG